MRFVPIPTPRSDEPIRETGIYKTSQFWLPFIPRIADRSDETVDELIDHVVSGRVQIGLIWDEKERKAYALLGIVYSRLGRELIGELRWAAGWGTKEWRHLLPEVEKYLKEHVGCTISKPVCRPGWRPFLKQAGYRQTHVVMEKML
jgi:hypothetical protein